MGISYPLCLFSPENKKTPASGRRFASSFAYYHESGWINKESFLFWFEEFLEFSNPRDDVLLILGDQVSHTKSIEFFNRATETNVAILPLVAHQQILHLSSKYLQSCSNLLRIKKGEQRTTLTEEGTRPQSLLHLLAITSLDLKKLRKKKKTKQPRRRTKKQGEEKSRDLIILRRRKHPDAIFATTLPLVGLARKKQKKYGKSLSADKLADLKEISKLVPTNAKWFYKLSCSARSAEFEDDFDGFGSSMDFESEKGNNFWEQEQNDRK
ncbi:hypothetical protein ILUMI_13502 [Ignelater luminosus]|uniref:DDE-1 domain-containing protein n=1 Tax=Ignelater luminosus TaxID=2038154 RepID=A0A8K0CW45_IGNLU|nr:hypothetical protein ILUMI_13502 [Ignelater luminosus]